MADEKINQNIQKLEQLLGFDPTKSIVGNSLFQEALKEISEEQNKALKSKAKEVLLQAMELRRKMDAASKEFHKQEAKFAKDLGKLLNRLENMAQGRSGGDQEGENETEKNE